MQQLLGVTGQATRALCTLISLSAQLHSICKECLTIQNIDRVCISLMVPKNAIFFSLHGDLPRIYLTKFLVDVFQFLKPYNQLPLILNHNLLDFCFPTTSCGMRSLQTVNSSRNDFRIVVPFYQFTPN